MISYLSNSTSAVAIHFSFSANRMHSTTTLFGNCTAERLNQSIKHSIHSNRYFPACGQYLAIVI